MLQNVSSQILILAIAITTLATEASITRKTYSVWDTSESQPEDQLSKEQVPKHEGNLEKTLENFKRSTLLSSRRRTKKTNYPSKIGGLPHRFCQILDESDKT